MDFSWQWFFKGVARLIQVVVIWFALAALAYLLIVAAFLTAPIHALQSRFLGLIPTCSKQGHDSGEN
jgi:hypothetical protein